MQTTDYTWELFFTVINNANKLINKAVPEDATLEEQYEESLGETYFLVDCLIFIWYAYGDLPLILTNAATNMPRTAGDIYDQLLFQSLKKGSRTVSTKSQRF